MHYQSKKNAAIDYQEVLHYPLSRIPLSLTNSDGTMRKTTKSTFKAIIIGDSNFSISLNAAGTLVIDLVSLFHQLVETKKNNYEQICKRIISMVSTVIDRVERVDFVADNYTKNISPIKKGEHAMRGESDPIIIKSLKSKAAKEFKEPILRNATNKTRLIELFVQYVSENSSDVLQQLGCGTIYISTEGHCYKITAGQTSSEAQLKSNQPEADTRLILHARHALASTKSDVYIYSPSADTDVMVLCVSLLSDESHRVHIADGSGKRLKVYKLSDIEVDDDHRLALIGLYAFTGNDYVSSLFGIGKKKAYKQMTSDEKYVWLFQELGDDIEPVSIEEHLDWMESFICQVYNEKDYTSVNEARYSIFKKQLAKNKTVSLSKIPPCRSVLKLHLERSAYIAYLWKRSQEPQIELFPIEKYGWFQDGQIVWTEEEIFPATISKYMSEENETVLYDDEEDDIFSEEDSVGDDEA